MLVMIVEDNSLLAFMLEDALTERGYEVLGPASSVAEALVLVEQGRPALALVDIDLEGGRSGAELADELHTHHAIPVLFATGQLEQARTCRDRALGVLNKPFSPGDAVAAVEAVDAWLQGVARTALPAVPNLEWFPAASEAAQEG